MDTAQIKEIAISLLCLTRDFEQTQDKAEVMDLEMELDALKQRLQEAV